MIFFLFALEMGKEISNNNSIGNINEEDDKDDNSGVLIISEENDEIIAIKVFYSINEKIIENYFKKFSKKMKEIYKNNLIKLKLFIK